MKYLKRFKDQAAGIGYTAKTPFVSTVKTVDKKVLYIPKSVGDEVEVIDDGNGFITYEKEKEITPLCFTALAANSKVGILDYGYTGTWTYEYKLNSGNWTEYTLGTDITLENVGDKVYFRGSKDSTPSSATACRQFYNGTDDDSLSVSGDITSLLNNIGGVLDLTPYGIYTFVMLFASAYKIVDASGLSLPSTTLTEGCYAGMFLQCTGLVTPPSFLPATTLATACYTMMFNACSELTAVPAFPSSFTTAQGCCTGMFMQCSKITSSPILSAEVLATECYGMMFMQCSALNKVYCYATDISAGACVENWLEGVSSTGNFYGKSAAGWTTSSDSGIPEGWTAHLD